MLELILSSNLTKVRQQIQGLEYELRHEGLPAKDKAIFEESLKQLMVQRENLERGR